MQWVREMTCNWIGTNQTWARRYRIHIMNRQDKALSRPLHPVPASFITPSSPGKHVLRRRVEEPEGHEKAFWGTDIQIQQT